MISLMSRCSSHVIAVFVAALLVASVASRADSPIDPRLATLLDVAYANRTPVEVATSRPVSCRTRSEEHPPWWP